MLTEAIEKYPIKATTCFVATDYTCSPSVDHSKLDYYFIPDESLRAEFENRGLPRDNIVVSGIPVKDSFYEAFNNKEAKKLLGLEENDIHIVLMCGSMGCGPMFYIVCTIADNIQQNQHLTVVCGTNKRLYSQLQRRFRNNRNIHIKGFIDNIPSLLQSADLYITKPGGISVTEASAMALPMIFIDAVAGCEEHNMNYFIKTGGAVNAVNIKNLVDSCTFLLENTDVLLSMSDCLKTTTPGNPSDFIYDYLQNNKQSHNSKELMTK